MHLKPPPPIVIKIFSIILTPFALILITPIILMDEIEKFYLKRIKKRGWYKVFAIFPVECDPWPDDGFKGVVWLERVWKNNDPPGWSKYRREAPPSE